SHLRPSGFGGQVAWSRVGSPIRPGRSRPVNGGGSASWPAPTSDPPLRIGGGGLPLAVEGAFGSGGLASAFGPPAASRTKTLPPRRRLRRFLPRGWLSGAGRPSWTAPAAPPR